jgi:hypothetical protein
MIADSKRPTRGNQLPKPTAVNIPALLEFTAFSASRFPKQPCAGEFALEIESDKGLG